mmetsp:Transcript_15932/g.33701  ORF Transcript_15932/g.33701 Transcript_15932/m.33701 type:complete len:504 (-) Transcript_15932:153-1664(-)
MLRQLTHGRHGRRPVPAVALHVQFQIVNDAGDGLVVRPRRVDVAANVRRGQDRGRVDGRRSSRRADGTGQEGVVIADGTVSRLPRLSTVARVLQQRRHRGGSGGRHGLGGSAVEPRAVELVLAGRIEGFEVGKVFESQLVVAASVAVRAVAETSVGGSLSGRRVPIPLEGETALHFGTRRPRPNILLRLVRHGHHARPSRHPGHSRAGTLPRILVLHQRGKECVAVLLRGVAEGRSIQRRHELLLAASPAGDVAGAGTRVLLPRRDAIVLLVLVVRAQAHLLRSRQPHPAQALPVRAHGAPAVRRVDGHPVRLAGRVARAVIAGGVQRRGAVLRRREVHAAGAAGKVAAAVAACAPVGHAPVRAEPVGRQRRLVRAHDGVVHQGHRGGRGRRLRVGIVVVVRRRRAPRGVGGVRAAAPAAGSAQAPAGRAGGAGDGAVFGTLLLGDHGERRFLVEIVVVKIGRVDEFVGWELAVAVVVAGVARIDVEARRVRAGGGIGVGRGR